MAQSNCRIDITKKEDLTKRVTKSAADEALSNMWGSAPDPDPELEVIVKDAHAYMQIDRDRSLAKGLPLYTLQLDLSAFGDQLPETGDTIEVTEFSDILHLKGKWFVRINPFIDTETKQVEFLISR